MNKQCKLEVEQIHLHLSLFPIAFSPIATQALAMEEVVESDTSWLHELDEELSKGLLDDTPPFVFSPEAVQSEANTPHESLMNKLISTVYSGPTISDIENALALSYRSNETDRRSCRQPMFSVAEKGHGKIDNKYTLKIKSCGTGLADDGYKWRKYGQKSIKNSPNPRSYYRCTNPRCNAKKQVERSIEDTETLLVTYEGLHLHYTYSHFLLPRPPNSLSATDLPLPKKPKIPNTGSEDRHDEEDKTQNPATRNQEEPEQRADNPQEELPKDSMPTNLGIGEEITKHALLLEEEPSPQGLLEDIVPLLVRKPCSSSTSSNEPSSPSRVSSPSYSSSICWSPADFYFDVGILSSII